MQNRQLLQALTLTLVNHCFRAAMEIPSYYIPESDSYQVIIKDYKPLMNKTQATVKTKSATNKGRKVFTGNGYPDFLLSITY